MLRGWPFLIQWDASDEERAGALRSGKHELPVIGVRGVEISVREEELPNLKDVYREGLGLTPLATDELYAAGGAAIRLVSSAESTGLATLELAVSDLDEAERVLVQRGQSFDRGPDGMELEAGLTLGRLLLVP